MAALSATLLLITLVCGDAVVAREPINVITFANPAYAVGIAALISAARKHTSTRVRFWVGYDGDPSFFLQYLDCLGVDAANVTVRRPQLLVDVVRLTLALHFRFPLHNILQTSVSKRAG